MISYNLSIQTVDVRRIVAIHAQDFRWSIVGFVAVYQLEGQQDVKINIKGKTLHECDFNERTALAVVDSYYRSMSLFKVGQEVSSLETANAITAALGVILPDKAALWDRIYGGSIRGALEDFANAYFPEYVFEFEEPAPEAIDPTLMKQD